MPYRQPCIGVASWIAALLISWLLGMPPAASAEAIVASTPARTQPLITDIPAAGGLAAVASGQTAFVIDEAAGSVTGFDPFAPAKRWLAVPAAARPTDGPVAIGCIDSTTLATVARLEKEWALRTYRLGPPNQEARDLAPRWTTPLGPAADADRPQVTIGLARKWMLVTGCTGGQGQPQFFSIHGAEPKLLARREPQQRPPVVAAAGLPGDALALFRAATDAARLVMSANVEPRPLLDLDTGLPAVRAAAANRTTGELWVAAGTAGSATTPEGVWRIEATLRDGRQAVRAVCIFQCDAPRSLVWISDRMLLVTHGAGKRMVSRVDPSTAAPPGDASP